VATARLHEDDPNWERSFACKNNLNVFFASYHQLYQIRKKGYAKKTTLG
jgi:hypothetical protein